MSSNLLFTACRQQLTNFEPATSYLPAAPLQFSIPESHDKTKK
jgi:hypothetical protein